MSAIQYHLFEQTVQDQFQEWIHTKSGGMAMNFFIREARRMKKRGFTTCGAKMIIEHIRWLMKLESDPKDKEQDFKINNNYAPHMARYAMEKDSFLEGFFRLRKIGKNKTSSRAVIIPIQKKG